MMKRSVSIPAALERSIWPASPEPSLFGPAYGTDYHYTHVVVEELERKATEELFALFAKAGLGQEADSSPRYFCGSPPARIPNPMVNDPVFLEKNRLASLSLGPSPPARVEILRTRSEILLRRPRRVNGVNGTQLPDYPTQNNVHGYHICTQ